MEELETLQIFQVIENSWQNGGCFYASNEKKLTGINIRSLKLIN